MAIALTKILVAGGYGVVDTVLEKNPMTVPGLNISATDAVRLATTLGSYFLNNMGYYSDITETLFVASLPLTIKTVWNLVSGFMGGGGAKSIPVQTLTVMPPPRKRQLELIGIR